MRFNFCPNCKETLKETKDFFECAYCGMKIFKDSIPTASFFPVNKGKVLLAQRGVVPKKGSWDAIGGFLSPGEHPLDGIKREVKEETGLGIKVDGLLGIYMDEYEYQGIIHKTLGLTYIGKIKRGKMKAKDDVKALAWFPINSPPKQLAFKWLKQALKDLQKWYKQPRIKNPRFSR